MTWIRNLVAPTLAYAGVTFPLAYVWHLVTFADTYERLRFTTVAEPNIVLGFITILSQGVLLGLVYRRFRASDRPLRNGILFGLAMGAFIWSATAVAHVAKHDVGDPTTFIVLEAFYYALDFILYGTLLGLINRSARAVSVPLA